ncbi:hypothetical protein CQW23_08643 [Capsicum baccatum]|uniref:Calmodulin-binding domain-containing protein n=1 Tax=Capsicum baccatum TaxID=33114 RepID=A0A2G2XA06_CAPBA|nr:hypothetical protein CQW23_08643 [Capsicum baccatum]
MSDPKEDNGASKGQADKRSYISMWHMVSQHVLSDVASKVGNELLDGTNDGVEDNKSLTNLDITEDGKMLDKETKDPKEERELPLTTNKPKTQRSKNWSKLKKLILPRISIKGLEKARKFNPWAPQLLPATPNQETEKVDLRHQMADERKKAENGCLIMQCRIWSPR